MPFLYRGYKQQPRLLSAANRFSIAIGDRIRRRIRDVEGGGVTEIIRGLNSELGEDMAIFYWNLRNTDRPQAFGNELVVAKEYAGPDGYVMSLDVDPEFIRAHYAGSEMMFIDGTPRPADNHWLTPVEVFDLVKAGKAYLYQMRESTLVDVSSELPALLDGCTIETFKKDSTEELKEGDGPEAP